VAAALVVAAWSVAGCSRSTSEEAPPDRPTDRGFVAALISSHDATVRLALDAQARAERPELRSFARRMEVTRQREIGQLEALGFSREELGLGPAPTTGGGLPPTVSPYDRAFIDAVVPRQQDAVRAAIKAIGDAEQVRVKRLAERILDGQACEIYELNRLRTAWHGLPSPAGGAPLAPRDLRRVNRRCRRLSTTGG
jgi:uncharacterized protein (DUF305 family)